VTRAKAESDKAIKVYFKSKGREKIRKTTMILNNDFASFRGAKDTRNKQLFVGKKGRNQKKRGG
jgi:hypothetical protein